MTGIKRKYWTFYLLGREERRLRNDIDPRVVAKRILEQEEASVLAEVRLACEEAASALTPRIKKNWLVANGEEITAAAGDADEAYQAWVAGRVDELVVALESSVTDALAAELFEEEA